MRSQKEIHNHILLHQATIKRLEKEILVNQKKLREFKRRCDHTYDGKATAMDEIGICKICRNRVS